MKKNSDTNLEGIYKKSIYSRNIKGDKCILYADKAELLVVDEDLSKEIIRFGVEDIYNNKELFEVLLEYKFLENKNNNNNNYIIPKEGKGPFWDFSRIILLIIFLVAVITILINFRSLSIWNKFNLLKLDTSILYLFICGLIFSMVTTILHECIHMLFANNIRNIKEVLHLSIKKSTAYVSLTHVWTWSLPSRIIAVFAGIMLDNILLAVIILVRLAIDSEILVLFSIILFIRIIWQFRFHKKSDGKYFLMMLIDNPLIDIDYKNNINLLDKGEIFLWKMCMIIGVLVEIYLLIFWIVPFIYQLCLLLGGVLC